jgi:hypothetical protein
VGERQRRRSCVHGGPAGAVYIVSQQNCYKSQSSPNILEQDLNHGYTPPAWQPRAKLISISAAARAPEFPFFISSIRGSRRRRCLVCRDLPPALRCNATTHQACSASSIRLSHDDFVVRGTYAHRT